MPSPVVANALRAHLDGYAVERGHGRLCPSCGRQYDLDERLVVRVARSTDGAWSPPTLVCSDCVRDSIRPETERPDADQFLLRVDLAATPNALVLDGDSLELLDRSEPETA